MAAAREARGVAKPAVIHRRVLPARQSLHRAVSQGAARLLVATQVVTKQVVTTPVLLARRHPAIRPVMANPVTVLQATRPRGSLGARREAKPAEIHRRVLPARRSRHRATSQGAAK